MTECSDRYKVFMGVREDQRERVLERLSAHFISTGLGATSLRHLAAVRAGLPHLEASVAAEVLELDDPAVLAVLRRHPVGPNRSTRMASAGTPHSSSSVSAYDAKRAEPQT